MEKGFFLAPRVFLLGIEVSIFLHSYRQDFPTLDSGAAYTVFRSCKGEVDSGIASGIGAGFGAKISDCV